VNTERYKFIWETVGAVALAIAVMVAPSLFPNMPWWLSVVLFGGGVLATIIAFVALYVSQDKTESHASQTEDGSVSRESSEHKRIPIWNIVILVVTWIVVGGYMFYAFSTAPEYETGPSRQEITNVKEELSHLKPRTMVLECADVDTITDANMRCIRFLNSFHYMFINGLTPWMTRRRELYCHLNIPKE
jgi:hypothetical protein